MPLQLQLQRCAAESERLRDELAVRERLLAKIDQEATSVDEAVSKARKTNGKLRAKVSASKTPRPARVAFVTCAQSGTAKPAAARRLSLHPRSPCLLVSSGGRAVTVGPLLMAASNPINRHGLPAARTLRVPRI